MKSTNKTGKTKKAFHALRWTLVFGTHSDSVGASASGILTDHMELFGNLAFTEQNRVA